MSEQLSLSLARRTDHDSSARAAAKAVRSGLVYTHELVILRELASSRCAMTLRQLADATGLDHVAVARRMSAMVRRGLVRRIAVDGERLRWMMR